MNKSTTTTDEYESNYARAHDVHARIEAGALLALRLADTPERSSEIISEIDELCQTLTETDGRERAKVNVARSYLAYRHSQFENAATLATDAAAALTDDSVRAWRARAMQAAGGSLLSMGELDSALKILGEALEIALAVNEQYSAAQILILMGNAHLDLGDLNAAHIDYERCLEISRPNGFKGITAVILNNLGNVNARLKQYDSALRYYDESLVLLASIQPDFPRQLEVHARNNMGKVYSELGETVRARQCTQAALDVAIEIGYEPGIANASNSLGGILETAGKFAEAREHYDRCFDIARRVGQKMSIALALANLSTLDIHINELDQAHERILEALAIARDTGATTLLVEVCLAASKVFAARGEFERAMEMLREHYEIARKLDSEDARRRIQSVESNRELELARQAAEIERLRNVELAEAHARLQSTHDALESAHRALKSAQAQLVQAEKMASLGQLTAGIAHEINNPVNFIRASTAPLRRDLDEIRAALDDALLLLPTEFRSIVSARLNELEVDELRAEIDALLRGIEDGAARSADIVKGLR
ncbi:MAG: tetratricopeptide repeat protein, partial [bacterium]|nr:tetratricopeptide repeat protein [Candidatus Kapabacteria bacterium]